MTPSIDVLSDGPIRILTINNVEKRNAFSGDMAPRFGAASRRRTPTQQFAPSS